jgi:hypothetical protein
MACESGRELRKEPSERQRISLLLESADYGICPRDCTPDNR